MYLRRENKKLITSEQAEDRPVDVYGEVVDVNRVPDSSVKMVKGFRYLY
jgi:hypothetical protein